MNEASRGKTDEGGAVRVLELESGVTLQGAGESGLKREQDACGCISKARLSLHYGQCQFTRLHPSLAPTAAALARACIYCDSALEEARAERDEGLRALASAAARQRRL